MKSRSSVKAARCEHNDVPYAPVSWGCGSICIDCARQRRRDRNNTASARAARKRYNESAKGKGVTRLRVSRYKRRRIAEDNYPRERYRTHKSHAARRGIPFLLTFEQWWSLWAPHWPNRGNRRGQLVMGRKGDSGPYAVGNVEIITTAENNVQAVRNGRRTKRLAGKPAIAQAALAPYSV